MHAVEAAARQSRWALWPGAGCLISFEGDLIKDVELIRNIASFEAMKDDRDRK